MQDKPENLSKSLMYSVVNGYTSSALMEFSESMMDNLTDTVIQSDIVKQIPVISSIVGLVKAGLSFRERIYINKLVSFLSETAKADTTDRAKYMAKLDKNPEECRKAGEIILDLIDKITSTEKAIMIGKVFRAFMHENAITTSEVILLSEMVEKAYLSDLIALSRKENDPGDRWNDANLESVGIKKPMRVEDVNKAIESSVLEMRQAMPTIKEASNVQTIYKTQVEESGFTEHGWLLQRILQSY